MMKIKKINLLTLAAATVIFSGCNSGGAPANNSNNSNANITSATNNFSQESNVVTPPQNKLSVKSLGAVKLQVADSKSFVTDNGETYGPVGWNSATNSLASAACWAYTINFGPTTGSGVSSIAEKNADIQKSLGIDASIGAKIGTFSANGSVSYYNLTSTDTQGVMIGASAYTQGSVTISVTGLTTQGQNILTNTPDKFYSQCGDSVLTQLPIKTAINYVMTSSFESASVNTDLNTSIDVQTTFVNASTQINKQASSGNSSLSVLTGIFYSGGSIPGISDQVSGQLGACVAGSGFNASNCQDGLNGLASIAQKAYNDSLNNLKDGPNHTWQGDFYIDYANMTPTNFGTISAADQLTQLGLSGKIPESSPTLSTYKQAIIRNVQVLQDLVTAQSIMNTQIKNGINALPQDFAINFAPSPLTTNASLAAAYANSLDNSVNMLNQSINQCLSSYGNDIVTNCSQLDPSVTVDSIFNAGYQPVSTNIPQLKSAILNTVHALIYNDTVSSDNKYVNPQSGLVSGVNSYIVYIPVSSTWKPESDTTHSPYMLITVPTIGSIPTANIDGTAQSVYLSAYQLAAANPNQNFWGDWDLHSQSVSGALGFYEGYNEILFPNPARGLSTIGDTITPSYSTCSPFAQSSQGCIYTVVTQMDPAVTNLSNNPAQVTQSIKDTYNSYLAPNSTNLFGSNQFVTLYPFN